ncbi:hypothetical protein A8B75_15445 [Sphingomonadales bacterium EhC05]|nr:hypothetical protein A8B75_15445 [Sphingomonadales bacterium EhC05]
MSLHVIKAGLQSSLQGVPYRGHRHIGMPAAGAADCLSLAFANHLVGKEYGALAIEITLDDAKFSIGKKSTLALAGASSFLRINGSDQPKYEAVAVKPGDIVHIGSAKQGCRSYLALSGTFCAQSLLGGQSTYLPAGLGGFSGRSLLDGDDLDWTDPATMPPPTAPMPAKLQTRITNDFIIRITDGPECDWLAPRSKANLTESVWEIGNQTSRMGISLNGRPLQITGSANMHSAPAFSGTVQCPPNGQPFLLGPDAQTTGGYPRIAQVIRADRHLIGQLRPGGRIQFVAITPKRATEIYREKLVQLTRWAGNIHLW